MKLTKFGILVNKTTSLFTSIRDSKISRGCAKILEIVDGRGGKFWGPILENPERRGIIRQIPSVGGGVWIFSGTTQFEVFKGCYFFCYCLERAAKITQIAQITNFSTSEFNLGMIMVTPMGMKQ